MINAAALLAFASALAQAQQPKATGQTFLAHYCTGCHNQQLKTAGIVLDGVNPDQPGEYAKILEKVLRKVRTGEMPPPGLPRSEPVLNKVGVPEDRIGDSTGKLEHLTSV